MGGCAGPAKHTLRPFVVACHRLAVLGWRRKVASSQAASQCSVSRARSRVTLGHTLSTATWSTSPKTLSQPKMCWRTSATRASLTRHFLLEYCLFCLSKGLSGSNMYRASWRRLWGWRSEVSLGDGSSQSIKTPPSARNAIWLWVSMGQTSQTIGR